MPTTNILVDNDRWNLLQKYGAGCMAVHTMQSGLDYYDYDPCGYIAYKDHQMYRYALGDPICEPSTLKSFLLIFENSHPEISYFHISESTANHLNDLGYFINEMGQENIVDLENYSFSGRQKVNLRNLHNKAARSGVTVEECNDNSLLNNQEMDEITSKWLSRVKRKKKELWFLTRRPFHGVAPGVRHFCGMFGDKILAFVTFDPMYRDGQVYAYCASILRRRPEAPPGTLDLIIRDAMELFKKEGVESLSLGLCPLHEITDHISSDYRYSIFTQYMFRLTYRSKIANWLYGFNSLSFHKELYRTRTQKIYFATRSRYPVRRLVNAAFLIGVI